MNAKNIAHNLNISIQTFNYWIRVLKIEPAINEKGEKIYPDDCASIIAAAIELKQKDLPKSIDTTISHKNQDNKTTLSPKELVPITKLFLTEIKTYSQKAFAAETKICILEEKKSKLEEDCLKLSNELSDVKLKLEEREKSLAEFENYKNKMNRLEIQYKLLKLEQKKKKIWEFWKN